MTTNQSNHQKHGKTVRAKFGEFGRVELSILGTPCGDIKQLSEQIIGKLADKQIAYVDADHKTEEEEKSKFLRAGSQLVYTDKISFERFDTVQPMDKFHRNLRFNEYDLVLINGNHFSSKKQIVVIDERKPLEKKLEKVTDVVMILFSEGQSEIPRYLKDHIENIDQLPQYSITDIENISRDIDQYLGDQVPELWGLVLAGGKSQRMNRDKGLLEYHGVPHREYLHNQLSKFTSKTFVSCRKDQKEELAGQFDLIVDTFDDLGPYGAILSAFREYPDQAWLVLAVDLPILSEETIQQLVESRNPCKIATAFYNRETDFPEPLITIWEPKAYPVLLNFLGLGYGCPRKVLINSNIEMIKPDRPEELINANKPEEYEMMREKIARMSN